MVTVRIPSNTLPSGSHDFGPTAVPAGLTQMTLTLDVGSYPPDQSVTVSVSASYDGGAHYRQIASSTRNGGPGSVDGGGTTNDMVLQTPIGGDPASTTRRIKGTVVNGVTLTTAGGSLVAS
jgi:hypothetical protein